MMQEFTYRYIASVPRVSHIKSWHHLRNSRLRYNHLPRVSNAIISWCRKSIRYHCYFKNLQLLKLWKDNLFDLDFLFYWWSKQINMCAGKAIPTPEAKGALVFSDGIKPRLLNFCSLYKMSFFVLRNKFILKHQEPFKTQFYSWGL